MDKIQLNKKEKFMHEWLDRSNELVKSIANKPIDFKIYSISDKLGKKYNFTYEETEELTKAIGEHLKAIIEVLALCPHIKIVDWRNKHE